MPSINAVSAAVKAAITEINETLPRDRKISTVDDAPLYGPSGVVDSLTLTLLIVAIEQKIEQNLHCTISLVDLSMVADGNHAFRTTAALAEHITSLIGSKGQ